MDPYLDAVEYKDPSICRKCRSIYHDKRWVENEELYKNLMKNPDKITFTLCPACQKIETKYMEGRSNSKATSFLITRMRL